MDFEPGYESHKMMRVGAEVKNDACRPRNRRIRSPDCLLTTGTLDEARAPPGSMFDLHEADVAEGAIPHEACSMSHHSVTRVVVRQRENQVRFLGCCLQFPCVVKPIAQRLVADDVDPASQQR
jgi:hypothetical protein